jgi:hypothetical protein
MRSVVELEWWGVGCLGEEGPGRGRGDRVGNFGLEGEGLGWSVGGGGNGGEGLGCRCLGGSRWVDGKEKGERGSGWVWGGRL